jgi:flagellar L-ring protein precursor FlgH
MSFTGGGSGCIAGTCSGCSSIFLPAGSATVGGAMKAIAPQPATMATSADAGQARLTDLSFFAVLDPEPKVMRKHDLVTIIVREESEFSSEGTTDLKKNADLNAKIDQFIQFSLDNFELKNSMGTPAEIKMNGSRNFKGEATVDRIDSLTARITAEVVDVKPNGTLVLQARKRIKTDEEVQQFVMTGICRAEDILPDNTLLSTQLYDLELNKSHKGAVRDTTKRGWVPKLLDAINPF